MHNMSFYDFYLGRDKYNVYSTQDIPKFPENYDTNYSLKAIQYNFLTI